MCTAISLCINDKHFFIRTLDLDCSFGQSIIICPMGQRLPLRLRGDMMTKHSFFGVGDIVDGFPLFAEGVNEAGVAISGLHFPTMSGYMPFNKCRVKSLAPFEIIPYILGNFTSTREACHFLSGIDIVDIPFNSQIKNTPLHFHISDKYEVYAIEIIDKKITIRANPFGVLTNAPPFSFHKYNMARYQNISAEPAKDKNDNRIYSNGLLGVGLPGDFSSPSRFARAAYLRKEAKCECGLEMPTALSVAEAMSIPSGAVLNNDKRLHFTRYFVVYDLENMRVLVKDCKSLIPKLFELKKESLMEGSLISYAI